MSCTDALSLLDAYAHDELAAVDCETLFAHARRCARCSAALASVRALRALDQQPVPLPREGFLTDVARLAARQSLESGAQQPATNRFWMGAAIGSSLAAGLLLTLGWFGGMLETHGRVHSAQLLTLHGTRDVNIAIDSASEIAEAELRVVVSGNIAVHGYEDRNELRWSARLERGVNLLTLPVVLQRPTGGHLLVEVAYGSERKTFAVHVRDETASSDTSEDRRSSSFIPSAA